MVNFDSIVSYVSTGRKSIDDLIDCPPFSMSRQEISLFRSVFKLSEIAVCEIGDLYGLLNQSLLQIVPKDREGRNRIKYIFHCHASPCVCPPGVDLLNTLKEQHGLQHAVAVGLSHDQCATPLSAINLAEILLAEEDADAQVLVLAGEIGFHPSLRVIPNTTVMGDASAACLIGKGGGPNTVLSVAARRFKQNTDVQLQTGIVPTPSIPYGSDLIGVVKDALSAASLEIGDMTVVLGHNVNTISWKFFARNFPCPERLVYLDNVEKIGHCFTSDPFVNYCDFSRSRGFKSGEHFMFVSVGTSSSYVAAVVKH